ncbi:MAG: lytic transglycosylase domain-containing protein [Verrucomicrobia bacterium]|jgi:membrane-bound lytic murein transglycosylase D|nr:lytic transglycosylase domain-containing protein [Verrucomicrobiota bacterium]
MNPWNDIPTRGRVGRVTLCARFAPNVAGRGAHGVTRPTWLSAPKLRFHFKVICSPLALILMLSCIASAQEFELDTNMLNQALDSASVWATENLDEDVLRVLNQADRKQVEQFIRDLQKSLQGEYVLDLASLKTVANLVVPLLEAHEETQPYAAWLKARLDYLDAADELRRLAPLPPVVPGQPPPPPVNPSPSDERTVWQKKLTDRPWPKGAAELVPKLKPIFVSERVPAELVWVAEVESGFDRRARSPAGAAGLFQFMPATAKRFGLRSWPRDQRYQPEPSARAAAQYLRQLHDKFGDWPLALAAYNAGEGTVQRLLDRHKTRSFDSVATRLPAETQMFVPKVEATVLRREGVALTKLKAHRPKLTGILN